MEISCSVLGSPSTGKTLTKLVQWRATKVLRGTECLLCGEGLWEMGLSRTEKKRFWGADSTSPIPAPAYQDRRLCLHREVRQEDTGHNLQRWRLWPDIKIFPCKDRQALEQGHRDWGIFVFGGFKAWMNKALVWTWCWSPFEQQVGLDTSWGPFQPELLCDINLDPREYYRGLVQFSMPDDTFQISTKIQPLLTGDRKHIVWFFSSQEHMMLPSRIRNISVSKLEFQDILGTQQLPKCSTSGTQWLNTQLFFLGGGGRGGEQGQKVAFTPRQH